MQLSHPVQASSSPTTGGKKPFWFKESDTPKTFWGHTNLQIPQSFMPLHASRST